MVVPSLGRSPSGHIRKRGQAVRRLFGRGAGWKTIAQGGAASLVFGLLFISCVSSEAPPEDTRPVLTEEDALYGEITGDLDSPLWDEGEGQARLASDNPIDRGLSQSPFEPEPGSSKSIQQNSKKSPKKVLATKTRSVKKASKHKATPSSQHHAPSRGKK